MVLARVVLWYAQVGTRVYFTIRQNAPQDMGGVPVVKVNYDSLGEDVEVGDGRRRPSSHAGKGLTSREHVLD